MLEFSLASLTASRSIISTINVATFPQKRRENNNNNYQKNSRTFVFTLLLILVADGG